VEKVLEKKIELLVKKHNYRPFMYVEYPHKSFWSKTFDDQDFRNGLKNLFLSNKDVPLLFYIHIPFCAQKCYYCTCHTIITSDYERIKNYLELLYSEIELYRDFFKKNHIKPNFQEIHIGGGSPTLLREKEFSELVEKINLVAKIKKTSEFSLEIDPRDVDAEKLKYYNSKGINRISIGVQDFNTNVQKAINRIQPVNLITRLLTPEVRKYFKNGINFDIICGLPHQTPETIRNTFRKVVEMSPDRICFNYLHYAPKFAKHQDLMFDGKEARPTRLPDLYEKKVLFAEALDILLASGYVRTGYDHFAKPADSVAKAMSEKKMHWNALGVTSGRYSDVIGMGIHSYSTFGNYYSQNFHKVPEYEAVLRGNKFPIYRGHNLHEDDLVRRDIILSLRNYFMVDYKQVEKKHNIDFRQYFKKEISDLAKFVEDNIIEISESAIIITELGYQFADTVCSYFDLYFKNEKLKETSSGGEKERVKMKGSYAGER